MKHIAAYLSIAISIFLSACTDGMELEKPTGGLLISLTEERGETVSRATPAELGKPMPEQFMLKITKDDTGSVVYNSSYKESTIYTFAGNYTLEASCGDNPILAWDSPYYAGTASATVLDGKATHAQIPVSVQNALVSVEFANPDMFAQLYRDYGLEVMAPDGSGSAIGMTITPNATERSLYFRAESDITISFVATTLSGTTVRHPLNDALGSSLPLKAAQHAKISLAASNTGINVTKVAIKEVTISETIPQNWLPKPKASTAGFSGNTLTMTETESKTASVSFAVAAPVQEATFTLNFNAPQYAALMELNGSYTLSTLTAEQRTAMQNFGITLPNIGDNNCTFDFSGLTSHLQTDNGTATANTISIDVKANNRWASSGTDAQGTVDAYTINVDKPTFSVSAQPEHMWSKEFSIDEVVISTGDAEKIKSNLKYQYSQDGVTWHDCNDNRRHKFSTHPSNKGYQVRACYRNAVGSSTANVTLEETTQLPNSDMEQWHYTEIDGGWFGTNTPTYYPWNSGGSSYWDTNNDYTTRYRTWGSVAPYNCFPAVSYSSTSHSGRAAELRNTAAGSGNTNAGSASINYDYNKVPGMLFLGVLNDDDGTISEKGRAFQSRPVGISFWYTYSPMNDDKFDVTLCWMDNTGNTIAEITKQISGAQSSYKQELVTIAVDDTQLYSKASKLFVQFRSSIYSGSSLPWSKDVSVYTEGYDKTFQTWAGSVLRIDDISLVYDK